MFSAIAVSFLAAITALDDRVQSIHVNAWLVTLIVGTVLPILVGLATKAEFKYKGIALIVLNAVSAFIVINTLPDGGATFTAQAGLTWAIGVVGSTLAYKHVWAPLGITNQPADNKDGKAALAPAKGLG